MMHKQTHIHIHVHEILQVPSITRQLEFGQTSSCIENTIILFIFVYICTNIYTRIYIHTCK